MDKQYVERRFIEITNKYFSKVFETLDKDTKLPIIDIPGFLKDMAPLYEECEKYTEQTAPWLTLSDPIAKPDSEEASAIYMNIEYATTHYLDSLSNAEALDTEDSCVLRYLTEPNFADFVEKFLKALSIEATNRVTKTKENAASDDRQMRIMETLADINSEYGELNLKYLELQKTVSKLEEREEDLAEAISESQKIVKKANDTAESAATTVKSAEEAVEGAQKATADAKQIGENLLPNVLTVLGIFVAIVVAVMASYLNIILSSQNSSGTEFVAAFFSFIRSDGTSEAIPLLQSVFVGHLTLNLIVLLVFLISKVSQRSIANYCSAGMTRDCSECKGAKCGRCNFLQRIWHKFSYLAAINITFFIGYILWLIIFL